MITCTGHGMSPHTGKVLSLLGMVKMYESYWYCVAMNELNIS